MASHARGHQTLLLVQTTSATLQTKPVLNQEMVIRAQIHLTLSLVMNTSVILGHCNVLLVVTDNRARVHMIAPNITATLKPSSV